ncbi:hypothetical protein [Caulobacter sp. 17J80-11]|uniref:hypothetical protein n=1 Tax=Caulobacter sp. 17J80-11 TaxID=2763502 RepID=UPI0016536CA5|nr:hypothetical protein [Caulobacter sp. 17J80-11]MBC6981638.1 hypothetical protein [Caulobacter sp. 17J80-11]
MTDDQIQTIRDDIAFMKAMAEEGRRAPLLGGAILANAGAIFAGASVANWAIGTGRLAVGPMGYFVVWGFAMVAFVVALVVLTRRVKRQPGASTPANRAFGTAWSAAGFAIFALWVALMVADWRLQTHLVWMLFPSMILALYGLGWSVSAAMSGQKWLNVVAIGAFVGAPALAWFAGEPEQYLAYAAALLLLAAVPGMLLMRKEPSDIV